jgi:Cysteine-rich CPXCG
MRRHPKEDVKIDPIMTDDEATVLCPYCGEPNQVALDPSGGRSQDYVEDCQVCCQPWRVSVRYRRNGNAEVTLRASDE